MLADFPEESKVFRTRYFQYGKARFKNHNSMLFTYPGMEGLKTGFTRASGFNLLTSARRQDKHLVAVVLGGNSSRQRNARMRQLLDQSWSKAVALNELKQKGDEPIAIAGVFSPDMMPERNPAFHAGEAEEQLRIAMAEARKSEDSEGREMASPGLALASLTAQGQAPTEDNNEDAAETDEAPADDPVEAKAETVVSDATALGPYHVQVGSFLDVVSAKQRLTIVAGKAKKLVDGHGELTVPGEVRGKNYFRARFGQFTKEDAAAACSKLKRLSFECLVVRVE
jgi:D-alanyl-D-alanine carboxypeptidase